MIAPARRACFEILRQIESGRVFSDDALASDTVSRLDPRDRNLATEITYGTLRWRGWCDAVLAPAVKRSWRSVDPDLATLLRMSLYQMAKMDRIPDHALIHDAVDLARETARRGAERFVNGVLRGLGRNRPWTEQGFDRDWPPWARASLPRWLWERWAARFGESAAFEYALSLNEPPQIAFRRAGNHPRDEALPPRAARASEIVPGAWILEGAARPAERPERVQDEASQLVAYLFGPAEGWRIWDACAAPGGKSAILRETAGPAGRITSSDVQFARIRRLRTSLESSGGAPFDLLAADARLAPPFRKPFDAVLADVPCSGLGTLRRNPEIKWRVRPERLPAMQRIQRFILDAVASAVRPGGMLLYSTCSTEPEEDEIVVEGFLRGHADFALRRPGFPPGIARWIGPDGMVRTFPGDRHWDGFFSALLQRSPSPIGEPL